MGFLRKTEHIDVEPGQKVEIIAHKKATKAQVAKVKQANKTLNQLFEDNHFTLTIYLAAGGKK